MRPICSTVILGLTVLVHCAASAAEPIPILIDTDIGSAVDDHYALALALASPEFEIRGITTCGSDPKIRAMMVARLLTAVTRPDVPFAAGAEPQPKSEIKELYQYYYHPSVLFNRTLKPVEKPAAEFLFERLKAGSGKTTIIALGPLTNIAALLRAYPEAEKKIQNIVVMGGSIRTGYNGKPPAEPEWNIKTDVPAARAVLASGVPLKLVPLDATANLKLVAAQREKLFKAGTMLTFQLQNAQELLPNEDPVLFDPLAVALALDEKISTWETLRIAIDDDGTTRELKQGGNEVRVATLTVGDRFLDLFILHMMSFGKSAWPDPPKNESSLVARGNLPLRIHAFEDYETDIERRWWLSGRLETKRVPPGSTRAFRGVLTEDFDDRQGNRQTVYSAVIFNPVPGPPMGENTRLAFRYRLAGTDTLRVQLYSLTNGYHRYLSLRGLPQGEWQSVAVDMTKMRRPDGSGGPLAKDERIDDIQFYVDPRAEVLIDDVVLYDAAPDGEKQPFPKRLLFTGWFDTGKQGKEWPGDFEIVPHEPPLTWKAAKSIPSERFATPWIRLDLRGERVLGEKTHLRFRYRLTEGDKFNVALVNKTQGVWHAIQVEGVKTNAWSEISLDFSANSKLIVGDKRPMPGDKVLEILFFPTAGSELFIDDVLLYEPGD